MNIQILVLNLFAVSSWGLRERYLHGQAKDFRNSSGRFMGECSNPDGG